MSGNSIPDIPRPRSGDPETQRFYDAVRQAFAAVQRTDSQALVTYEELGRRLLPLYDQYKNISDKVGGGKACDGASVPGAVSNIQTSGAFGIITLTWDAPMYRGHGSTEVWASKGTDVAAAELVGASETTYLEHAVPAIEFTTENEYEVSRNYWLRHVSACDKGYGPWSDMVTASTPASPTLIGELMAKNADAMIQSLGLDQDLSALADGISEVRTVAQSAVTKADAVKLTADNAYAAVQTKAEASTVAGLDGRLDTVQAKYTVQTDVNGYVQGFGLLNTGSPTTSGMAFNVNNFYVTNTVNGTKNKPFMIEGNKVYADNLFVRQANIEKLNVMDIATSGVIKSANYVAGSSGWKIDNTGNAEFNTVRVRVNASDIVGSLVMAASSGQTTGASIDNGHGCVTSIFMDTSHLAGRSLAVTVIATATSFNGSYDNFFNAGIIAEGYVNGQKVASTLSTGGYDLTTTATGMGYVTGGGVIRVDGLAHDHFHPSTNFTINVTAIIAAQ